MDFTYLIACFIGVAVGLVAASTLGFTNLGGGRIIGVAVLISLLIDAILLVNWNAMGDFSAGFIAVDLGIIATMTLVGCLAGALPLLAGRAIWRRIKRIRMPS